MADCGSGQLVRTFRSADAMNYTEMAVNGTDAVAASAEYWVQLTSGERFPLFVVLMLFCMVTVFGNCLVIIAVVRERYLHTATNYFITSLAFADFLVGLVVMPVSAVHEVFDHYWTFGINACDVWRSLDVLFSTASILNLCVISLDRYWAITDPFTYPTKMSRKQAYRLIAAVWVCSSVISFPAIVWWRLVRAEPVPVNTCPFTNSIGYLIFSSTISFYVPLLVMVFTYYKIYTAAVTQTRCQRLGTKLQKNFSLSRKLSKLSREKKAAKTLGIVMGVFIVCWLPFFVVNLLSGFCDEVSCVFKDPLLSSVVAWLGWINSGMNPVIYACWSRDFRRYDPSNTIVVAKFYHAQFHAIRFYQNISKTVVDRRRNHKAEMVKKTFQKHIPGLSFFFFFLGSNPKVKTLIGTPFGDGYLKRSKWLVPNLKAANRYGENVVYAPRCRTFRSKSYTFVRIETIRYAGTLKSINGIKIIY
ncbi:G protein-coupled receptor, rhodopsin-like,GPCR, rhodopsin-like, 7TM [Cinara cedri]|uniref:G protein-coupled receptor, rhodopsin-like,GPCR, rhodopsin-like, 7TM n=1 Tax=Cinara cedri TaxID=506608 RepID=A0A5E4N7A1_9HEMI|nr:G protein-coupled receptor, rhodopsin-like,GPCR, rhodopsin-like, 7TM [Cinara cedri]